MKSTKYEELYSSLDTKEGMDEVHRLGKARKRETRDFIYLCCVKRKEHMALIKGEDIKIRWEKYLRTSFNEKF